MATKVHMEALSPTMEEGQLVRWLKNEGDQVKEGDVLAEIETDKATMELVARGGGVLRARMLGEGQTAAVGTVIGVIAAPDEDISALAGNGARGGKAAAKAEVKEEEEGEEEGDEEVEEKVEEKEKEKEKGKPAAARKSGVHPEHAAGPETEKPKVDRRAAPRDGKEEEDRAHKERREQEDQPSKTAPKREARTGERVKASPLARRLAAESGVELTNVSGSGPGGRIIRRDIEAAGTEEPEAEAPEPAAARARAPQLAGEVEEVPVSQMRKTIAKRLVTSIGPIPTFYLTIEVDMSRMVETRERVNERLADSGVKASINDFIIKAVAAALVRHPEVNASWHESSIKRYRSVHIGVAVAVEDGLITPIVRDAERKGVADIAGEVRELAKRAREKKLKPEEYTGATFSISNLGMFGIDEFTAIINPPEAAILAVGAVTDTVVAENGQAVVRPRMRMTMSCDHRVIDGATGAKFLATLRSFMEDPVMMMV